MHSRDPVRREWSTQKHIIAMQEHGSMLAVDPEASNFQSKFEKKVQEEDYHIWYSYIRARLYMLYSISTFRSQVSVTRASSTCIICFK